MRDESNQKERCKRIFTYAAWQMWKRVVNRPIELTLFNGCHFMAYPDCDSSSAAIYYKIPDYREVSLLRGMLPGKTLIDVGANVGLFTLCMADLVDYSILLEPNSIAARRAKQNMIRNGLKAEVYTLALSDIVGEIFLEDRGGVATTNRCLTSPVETPYPVHKIECTTLDCLFQERPDLVREIGLIKIDVEGHEKWVLRGMINTLSEMRPRVVMFEYLQRSNLEEIRETLRRVGYRIYALKRTGELAPLQETPKPFQNLFALPI